MSLRVWLPMIRTGSGVDVYTERLARGLRERGHQVFVSAFAHRYQYAPWLLHSTQPPAPVDAVLTNSWNGFAFARPGLRLVTVLHLCVHQPALRAHKSTAQHVFHRRCVLAWERRTIAAAEATVAVSLDAAAAAWRWYSPRSVVPILNGIDASRFRPLPTRTQYRCGTPVKLLFVGNVTRRKGADLLLPIMRVLGDQAVLRIAGRVQAHQRLSAMDGVEPLGVLDEAALIDAYNDADMLLFPSRQEGFGYAVAEALACGTPVIASDVSSLPELVADGRCGRLCAVGEPAAFASAVRELAADPEEMAAMRIRARAHACRYLEAERWLDEMESVLGGQPLQVEQRAGLAA